MNKEGYILAHLSGGAMLIDFSKKKKKIQFCSDHLVFLRVPPLR